jgi:hypothetical protein
MNTPSTNPCRDRRPSILCCNEISQKERGDYNESDRPVSPVEHPSSLFLPSPSTPPPLHCPTPRRPLRVLLIGERQDVLSTIQNLHKRGFADAGDWSIPLPYPPQNAVAQFIPRGLSHVVISVHTKYLS